MSAIDEDRDFDRDVKLLLEVLYARYQVDFRGYAMASLRRRVRQALARMQCATVTELGERLVAEPFLLPTVLDYLTVQVSEMFRDPTHFRALREEVMPILATYPSLKIWVAGCSAGEELYSLAILLWEEGLYDRTILYATDVNGEALRKAEAGIYPSERVRLFTENYRAAGGKAELSNYYTTAYGGALFHRTLRKNVVFSDHSLATDSVFGEMQLVTCRNVLIYFDQTLQNRALGLFADSLCPRGFLALGSKESLRGSTRAATFETFDARERIFRRR